MGGHIAGQHLRNLPCGSARCIDAKPHLRRTPPSSPQENILALEENSHHQHRLPQPQPALPGPGWGFSQALPLAPSATPYVIGVETGDCIISECHCCEPHFTDGDLNGSSLPGQGPHPPPFHRVTSRCRTHPPLSPPQRPLPVHMLVPRGMDTNAQDTHTHTHPRAHRLTHTPHTSALPPSIQGSVHLSPMHTHSNIAANTYMPTLPPPPLWHSTPSPSPV